jgi:hypothetical protein
VIIGATPGNQSSQVTFAVANVPDKGGSGGFINFWHGLYGGPTNPFNGASLLTVTIPTGTAGMSGIDTVYTLIATNHGQLGVTSFRSRLIPNRVRPSSVSVRGREQGEEL